MATRPELPDEHAPLDGPGVDRMLSGMAESMVLVGGQALAYWMGRFGLLIDGDLVSYDGDALGSVASARELALTLHASLLLPAKTARTALVAQLRVPTASGKPANIDVLHQLYTVDGLAKSVVFTRRVIRNSVRVERRPGAFIRVMDPFDLLESRVHNAAGLVPYKGPHVLTQAAWAIDVARAALLRLVRGEPSTLNARLGQQLQAMYTLAHSRAGRIVLRDHGIEVLDAIDQPALRELAPAHRVQLDKLAAALLKRRAVHR